MIVDVPYLPTDMQAEKNASSTAAASNDKAGYTPGSARKKKSAIDRNQFPIAAASPRKVPRSDVWSFIKKLIAVDGRYISRCIPRRWTLRRKPVDKMHTSVSVLRCPETVFGECNSGGFETFRRRRYDACGIFTQVKCLFWLRKVFRPSYFPSIMFIFISYLNKQDL